MKLAVLKEHVPGESRVAATPDSVRKLVTSGYTVAVEQGAGEPAQFTDGDYKEAGAVIEASASAALLGADIVIRVTPPFGNGDVLDVFPKGITLVSLNSPFQYAEENRELAMRQVNSFSLEMIPRITRAQSMDVLSSQSNLAGYRAVIEAVHTAQKVIPLMMTAAGTIKPAKVLILGAGVAGLQAIATAKRLGAVVSAFDVRPAVKEQVQSLGASFVEVPAPAQNAETAGGYAKEMDEDYRRRQSEKIAEVIRDQDIVITTALIPGKPAPTLITREMVQSMKQGAVIVDLAAVAGGNCELTQKDKVVVKHGVTIIGEEHILSRAARDASALFATNVVNFLQHLVRKDESGALKLIIDLNDEITKSTLLTYQGKVMHPLIGDKPVVSGARKTPMPEAATPRKVTDRKPHLREQEKSTRGAPSEWQES